MIGGAIGLGCVVLGVGFVRSTERSRTTGRNVAKSDLEVRQTAQRATDRRLPMSADQRADEDLRGDDLGVHQAGGDGLGDRRAPERAGEVGDGGQRHRLARG